MLQIGEFSLITRLSVKTLRYYHEEGLLVPDYIDDETGYRYYRASAVERAVAISSLRELEFSITEIREMLTNYSDDSELSGFFVSQQIKINEKMEHYQSISQKIDEIIQTTRRYEMFNINENNIIEKTLPDIIFAGHRFRGTYDSVGIAFKTCARAAGRYIAGPAMSLYYDGEYKERDADIEGGFPVSQSIKSTEVNCRILAGGKAITLIHKGSYDTLSKSYEKLYNYIEEKKFNVALPTREVYIKGPGMFFRGNPDKYITELQVMVS